MLHQRKREHTIIIFSVSKQFNSLFKNQVRTRITEERLKQKGISYRKVIGNENGRPVYSFVVSSDSYFNHNLKQLIFDQYSQDSILTVSPENIARIVSSNGRILSGGKLKRISIDNAIENHSNFTIAGNHAYIIE